MLPYIFISIFVFISYLWYRNRKKHFSLFRNLGIPGPEPNIFFGNFLEMFTKGNLKSQKEWISRYGRVLGYYYGLTPVLLVADANLLKSIQIKEFSKFINRGSVLKENIELSNGRINQNLARIKGSKWKQMRSVITPAFTTSKMRMMSPIINNTITTLLEIFEKFCESGESFEAYILLQKLTMDVIARTAFGIQSDFQKNSKDSVYNLLYMTTRRPFQIFFLMMTKSFMFLQPVFQCVQYVYGIMINKGVNPFQELMEKCEAIVTSRKKDPSKRRVDFLQLMIDSEIKESINNDEQILYAKQAEDSKEHTEKIKDSIREMKNGNMTNIRSLAMDEIVANALIFILAGYHTTSTALSFCILMMASFPEVQEKIRKEVNALLEVEKELDYDGIQKLQYLDQVFKEILRIYPPVHSFTRKVVENFQYGKILIPKGIEVQVQVYLMHHDPDYWENPEEFRPERFAPENANKINLSAWQSFGAGPRNCLGMRFAQMEAKLILARIIHKYRILATEETDKYPFEIVQSSSVIRPKHGAYIRLQRCINKD